MLTNVQPYIGQSQHFTLVRGQPLPSVSETVAGKHDIPEITERFIFAIIRQAVNYIHSRIRGVNISSRVAFNLPPNININQLDWEQLVYDLYNELIVLIQSIPGDSITITPWMVESIKQKVGIINLNGMITGKLSIIVLNTITNKQYIHELTQDFIAALVYFLPEDDLKLYFRDNSAEDDFLDADPIQIDYKLFEDNHYVDIVGRKRYTANIGYPDEEVTFDTPDFIQGVITAAIWTRQDPYSLINNIREGDVLLSF